MSQRRPDKPPVLTTGLVATYAGLSQQTIIRCFDKGLLKGFCVPGSRFRRIPVEECYRFFQASKIPTEKLLADYPHLKQEPAAA